jgi:hypothetical protein
MSKKTTYTTEGGEEVEPDDIAEQIDDQLQEAGVLFLKGSDGHRYFVSVGVKFVRSDE